MGPIFKERDEFATKNKPVLSGRASISTPKQGRDKSVPTGVLLIHHSLFGKSTVESILLRVSWFKQSIKCSISLYNMTRQL